MRTKSVRRAEVYRPAAGVSNCTLADPNEAIKLAIERAAPILAELIAGIVRAELGATRGAIEPPLVDCGQCGLGARAVKSLVDRGQLRAVKVRRRWYADPVALRALLPEPPPPPPAVMEPELDDEAAADRRADRILQDALRGTGLSLATKSADAPPKSATRARRAGR